MSTRICIFMISDVIHMQHLHIIHSRIVQIYRISVVCEYRNNRLHSPHMLQSTRRPRPQPLTISRKNVQTSHTRQCVINTVLGRTWRNPMYRLLHFMAIFMGNQCIPITTQHDASTTTSHHISLECPQKLRMLTA